MPVPRAMFIAALLPALPPSSLLTLLRSGVPVSISSDHSPYTCTLTEEVALDMDKMGLTEDEVIRNDFACSISGKPYPHV